MNINKANKYKINNGFTVVELLVVIVIIGILAAITLVSYRSLTDKANESAMTADLANAKKQFELYKVEHNVYPTGLDGSNCPTNPSVTPTDTNYCLKPGTSTVLTLTGATDNAYTLTAKKGNLTYKVTNLKPPTASIDTTDWVVIGAQTWAKTNLNVGTMVTGVTAQTNNSTLEKYCYNDTESNCTTYGALYQWDEAMQYVTTEKAKGVCPANSHIPSDAEWKTLEMQLGMTQAQADATGWRGTDQGTQLKSGGGSGINVLLAGHRNNGGPFGGMSSSTDLWSSSESSSSAWSRYLSDGYATVDRDIDVKVYGFSVRCLRN